jgi:cell division protein FtsL
MQEMESQVSMDWSVRMAAGTVGADRTRPVMAGFPLAALLRYAIYGMILVTVLMFYVWSRVDVRRSAAELDSAVSHLQVLEVERDRLRLELAMHRDLGRIEAAAQSMGLTSDVRIEDVAAR